MTIDLWKDAATRFGEHIQYYCPNSSFDGLRIQSNLCYFCNHHCCRDWNLRSAICNDRCGSLHSNFLPSWQFLNFSMHILSYFVFLSPRCFLFLHLFFIIYHVVKSLSISLLFFNCRFRPVMALTVDIVQCSQREMQAATWINNLLSLCWASALGDGYFEDWLWRKTICWSAGSYFTGWILFIRKKYNFFFFLKTLPLTKIVCVLTCFCIWSETTLKSGSNSTPLENPC